MTDSDQSVARDLHKMMVPTKDIFFFALRVRFVAYIYIILTDAYINNIAAVNTSPIDKIRALEFTL